MAQRFEEAVRDIGVSRIDLEQGSLGHPIRAATRLLQNIGLDYLNGERDLRKEVESQGGGDDISGEKWCPGLRRAVLDGIRSKGIGDGRDQSESDASVELKKLSKEQGWKLHIARDHIPFRRDCEQCVMTLGTGRPHRRTKQKSAYVLSVDVGGPMRVKSKDAHGSGYKFFLAGAYTKPRFDDVEPPKELDPEDLASLEYDFADLELEPAALPPTGNDLADLELDPVLPPSEHLSEYEPSLPEEDDPPEIFKVTAAEGLWNDDEKAEDQQREEADETEAVEGNRAIPMDHLYFVKPLKSKSGKHVKMAIQEIVMQLRHENLPVVRIHSDRAHEMRSVDLREWALNNNILLTRTEGQSPQGNGTAERAVRFMKRQARKLLRAAELDTSFWATAMLTAAHHQRESVLQPETYEPPCPYGSRVAIKRKVYGQGDRLDLIPRWTKGVYLGPVWDVGKGSAVLDETTKRITVTTHIRPNLRNAESVADRPVQEFEPPVRRRLRAKGPVDEDGVQVRSLKNNAPDKARKTLEKEILAEIDALGFKLNVKRPQLREQEGTLDEEGYTTVGAYQHGGKHGVTNFTKEHPDLTAKITQLFEMVFPEELFTSVTIVKNTKMPLHRDVFNDKRTKNLIIPLDVTPDAGVWEELRPGDQFQGTYMELEVNGKDTPGQVHSLRKEARVNPSRWHCAVQEQGGRRVLLAAHTIGSWKKLVADDVKILEDLGFQVPEEDAEEVAAMKAVCEANKEVEAHEYTVDGDELVHGFSEGDPTVEVDEEIRLCAKAAAENLYTYNIEGVLEDLRGADLRVVHTVHQREVEQNLPKWVSALAAEVAALETIGAVKRRRGKDAKSYLQSPGVTIVPGKAVFTVKPPSKEGEQYRRKARIVSCGNFQPKNSQEENYSGGAAAESVKLGVAEAARRRWWLCNGDISNAFLRAPVPKGTLLALRPPSVLVRAGLAEEGEVWQVQTALYGFRSSPRWWSTYRTETMKGATTTSGYQFIQGVADPDTWRIVDTSGVVRGVVIIYVDDYLIAAEKQACEETHEWFASTWKTNELQYATVDSPIRFLGMEIRQIAGPTGEFDGYSLDQEGYLEELLRHHGVGERDKSLIPAAREWMSTDPSTFPSTFSNDHLKEAQSRTGELAWMCQRTRPDISYVTNVMSSLAVRDPQRVCQIGKKCLEYLNATRRWRLHFRTGSSTLLTTYTDSSFSPDGGKSHGGTAHQGCLQMESINALLSDFEVEPTERSICVDNAAAITLATAEGGSWKTRHLKVRHHALRERVEQKWVIVEYCPGDMQLADGLTKVLTSQRMTQLMEFWGLMNPGDASAQRGNPEAPSPLAVDTSLELYGLVLMLVICSVAVWEGVRSCYRSQVEPFRLRYLQGEAKLPKKDMRRLNALLQRKPQDLSVDERQTLITLADAAGVDLTGVFSQDKVLVEASTTTTASLPGSSSARPIEMPSASAADVDFLRERRRQRRMLPRETSPPRSTYEDLVEEDDRRRRLYREAPPAPIGPLSRERPGRASRDVAVQVEVLKEMPRVVFTTPSGGCVHATRDCSTLNRSTKFIKKDVCAKCIPGQAETTERHVKRGRI
ncbi:RE1 [Symbiodinium sp. KB8]|nr:RE1 [Symbiodinium sp. KB8]